MVVVPVADQLMSLRGKKQLRHYLGSTDKADVHVDVYVSDDVELPIILCPCPDCGREDLACALT